MSPLCCPPLLALCEHVAVSGGYSEEEVEERQQVLRNTLDEQFGQNMMAMKESMSQQYEQTQGSLRKELDTARQQVSCFPCQRLRCTQLLYGNQYCYIVALYTC